MNSHRLFLTVFTVCILIIPNRVISQASDDELLTEIRQLYYGLQEELNGTSIQQFKDQVRYYMSEENIVFIRLFSSSHTIDNYFLPGRNWPCFSFLYGEDGEYRFYYDSAEDRYTLFKYILPEDHPEDYSTRSIEHMAKEILVLSRRAKIEIDNSLIPQTFIEEIEQLQDSLRSIRMDTLAIEPFVDPDDPSVPEDIRNELLYGQEATASLQSQDGQISVEYHSSWADCAGGSSEETYYFTRAGKWRLSSGTQTIADYREEEQTWQYRTIESIEYHSAQDAQLYGVKLQALGVEFPMHWMTGDSSR